MKKGGHRTVRSFLFIIGMPLWFFLVLFLFIFQNRASFLERIVRSLSELSLLKTHWLQSIAEGKGPFLGKMALSYDDIFYLAAFLIASFFLGRLLTQRFCVHQNFWHMDEWLPISIGIGLWIFSLLSLFLTLSGFLQKPFLAGIILIVLFAFLVDLIRKKRVIIPSENRIRPEDKGETSKESLIGLKRYLIVIISLSLLLAFLFSFRPPIHYDSLEYHLAAPSEMLKRNSFLYFPFDVHTNFPLYIEMLYLLALLISGWKLANFLNFAFLPLFLLLIYSFGKRLSGRRGALIGTAIFGSTYAVMDLATHPLVDLEFGFFTIASFLLLIEWLERKKEGYFYLSALLSGIALGIKYIALILTIPVNLLFLILFLWLREKDLERKPGRFRKRIWRVLPYALIIIAVASPWLIRNYMDTGDPIFPIAASTIGWEKWSPHQDRLLKMAANASFMNFRGLLSLPWRISFSERGFGSSTFIGPIFLAFLPLLLFFRKSRWDDILIGYAVSYFLLWGLSFNMMRFAIPLLAILSLLLGKAISVFVLMGTSRFLKVLILTVMILLTSMNLCYFLLRQVSFPNSLPVVLGLETEKSFLSKYLEYYEAIHLFNSTGAKDDKILFIGEARSFYAGKRAVWSSAYNENPIVKIVRKSETSHAIARCLRSSGFSHILYAPGEMRRLEKKYGTYQWTDEERRRFQQFLKEETIELFSDRGVFLLLIK